MRIGCRATAASATSRRDFATLDGGSSIAMAPRSSGGCPAAERRRNADADEQPAGNGRSEPGVVGRLGAVADRREGVKHEVAHQPPEPQRDRPHRLKLPRKPRVGKGGDDGDRAKRENALELEIHLHPDDQVVHEMGDDRGRGDGKDDPLGSHLPRVSRPGSVGVSHGEVRRRAATVRYTILRRDAGVDARLSTSGDVREHVDDRATRVFDEEAADSPWLVGERIDDSQPAADGLGVRGVDCRGFTDVNAEAGLRVLHLLRANNDLGRGVGGGTVDNLTAGPYDYYPAYSPDGSKIVFTRAPGGGEHLIVMDAAGGNEHQLTTGTAMDRSPA
jgi:hypothetical protein